MEGYFGSGVQTGLLREGLAAPKSTKIVMLHALNPYGFAWDRRVNEDNADINRNFVDHKKPPANRDLCRARRRRRTERPVARSDEGRECQAENLFAEARRFRVAGRISRGQYKYPDGIYYGGAKASWSQAMLRDVLHEELRDVRNLTVIDFHTGLGPHGHGEMISEDMPSSAAYRRAKKMWGERVCSSESGESVSAPLNGTVDKAVPAFLPETRVTFAALEVGTLPLRDVFDALRHDNFLHMHAKGKHRDAERIRRQIRAAFYPDTPKWKRMVWNTANEVVHAALKSFE